MATNKTKPVRNYRDRFVRYTQARERNRKAACKSAGERLKAAVTSGGSAEGAVRLPDFGLPEASHS